MCWHCHLDSSICWICCCYTSSHNQQWCHSILTCPDLYIVDIAARRWEVGSLWGRQKHNFQRLIICSLIRAVITQAEGMFVVVDNVVWVRVICVCVSAGRGLYYRGEGWWGGLQASAERHGHLVFHSRGAKRHLQTAVLCPSSGECLLPAAPGHTHKHARTHK